MENYENNTKEVIYVEKPSSGTKWIIISIFVALLIGVAVFTNPDDSTHKEKISKTIRTAMQSKFGESMNSEDDGAEVVGEMIAFAFVDGIVDMALSQGFEYHNCIIFSYTTFTRGNKSKTLSFGAFGKVFTFNKKELSNMMN